MQLNVVRFVSRCACGCAAAFGILVAGAPAAAQTYYWTTSPTAIVGGGGSWDNSTPNWTTNYPGGGGNVVWSSGANADFSGVGGVVNVSGNQSVNNLRFDGSGYTIAGGQLTLNPDGNSGVGIYGSGNATISSNITGGCVQMYGTGQVTLSGVNTYSSSAPNSDGGESTAVFSGTLAVTTYTAIPFVNGGGDASVDVEGGNAVAEHGRRLGLHRRAGDRDVGKRQR